MSHHPSFRNPSFRKHGGTRARDERAALHLVRGEGIVPLRPDPGTGTVTMDRADGTLADLLAERGKLCEPQCRAIGVQTSHAVERVHAMGLVHGDIKPANIGFAPTEGLWLLDFDAAARANAPRRRGTPARLTDTTRVQTCDDIMAIAVMVVEAATGAIIDPASPWSAGLLVSLGCPAELAGDLETILRDRPSAAHAGALLHRRDDRLPEPPHCRDAVDPTPTLDLAPSTLTGLTPVGDGPCAAGAPD